MGITRLMGRHRDDGASSHVKPQTESLSPPPAPLPQNSEKPESKAAAKYYNVPSDADLLQRARDAHSSVDFDSLAAPLEATGDWKRVEAADQFVVFKRQTSVTNNMDSPKSGLEVLCAGRVDASHEEIASILRSSSEAEHNTVMSGLYAKSFIFGSYEREVLCSENQDEEFDDEDEDANEQLAVKTKSFSRTTLFAHNEQWCYFDYFQRNEEAKSFTISKRALHASETTPGRIVGENTRVDQLHGLNASYLVEKIPEKKELRVVFHAWFELSEQDLMALPMRKRKGSRRKSQDTASVNSTTASRVNTDYKEASQRAQLRRLLAIAHGVTKLPELVRRRRYGVQVPADLNAGHASNSRCPCCTRKLVPVKLGLTSIFVKSNSKRCYLCGYLVCTDCWKAEHMECSVGRVAAIVVCTRCHANVQACEYAEVFAGSAAQREKHRGPPRVVEDLDNTSTASLLVDFLSESLLSSTVGSPEHTAMMAVIRTLLEDNEDDEGGESYNSSEEEPRFEELNAAEAVQKVGDLLSDQEQLPTLESCTLGNAAQRNYQLDLPDDPTVNVPLSPIPSNENDRLACAKASGLLQLAQCIAPESPSTEPTESKGKKPDTQDLEVLCRLAIKTLGCQYSFVTVMGSKHEHILAGTHPDFIGAAVPREQTTCQHALMSPYPFMATHHEADVRFHNQGAAKQLPIRFYIGFPVMISRVDGGPGDPELTVGMLCCIDAKPRAEITRIQYATMNRLASTAKSFLLKKSQQLRLENGGDYSRKL